MKIAVATLGNFHANPFGPELQVKRNVRATPPARQKNCNNLIQYMFIGMNI
jgi:hypothetical protein